MRTAAVNMLTEAELQLIHAIDAFCDQCHTASASKGFWNDYDEIRKLVSDAGVIGDQNGIVDTTPERSKRLAKALESLMIGQKLALMHSELSEALEGSRKDLSSDKLPGFTAEEEEIADMIIRAGDFSGKRRLRLGLAIVLKLRYNAGRPYMHGKNF